MSPPKKIILSDIKVSRMMAEKAVHDQDFRDLLSDVASTGQLQTRGKKLRAIDQTMTDFRKQIVDEAGLEAPKDVSGHELNLNTYLKQVTYSRMLVSKASAQGGQGAVVVSGKDGHEWEWVGNPVCVARLALCTLQSMLRFQVDPSPFPFEQLPPELRLRVYREALRGHLRDGVAYGGKISVTCNRNKKFQYQWDGQQKGDSKDINTSILATNRLVNNEAIHVLYQLHTFDFKNNAGSVVLFMRTMSKEARKNIHGIAMQLHDKGEPDHCCGGLDNAWGKGPDNQIAWEKACTYIAENVTVKELTLTINVKVAADFRSLQWVKALVRIKGLKRLRLQAKQHCYDTVLTRVTYKDGSLAATTHCFSEDLPRLFEYLREEMLE